MAYKIIEVHAIFKGNQLEELAVLWQENELGWVRATFCDNKPKNGYKFLMPKDELNLKLLQDVAGLGQNLPDEKKDKYFSGKRLWGR